MKNAVFISIILLLAACAHHRDVRPGTNGVHKVVVVSENETGGQRNAISQANHFCKERYQKIAAFEKEGTNYTGDMDEANYKRMKTASKILKTGGGSVWAFGGKKEKNAGKVATGTGAVLDSAMGNGYTTEMEFKCI